MVAMAGPWDGSRGVLHVGSRADLGERSCVHRIAELDGEATQTC